MGIRLRKVCILHKQNLLRAHTSQQAKKRVKYKPKQMMLACACQSALSTISEITTRLSVTFKRLSLLFSFFLSRSFNKRSWSHNMSIDSGLKLFSSRVSDCKREKRETKFYRKAKRKRASETERKAGEESGQVALSSRERADLCASIEKLVS